MSNMHTHSCCIILLTRMLCSFALGQAPKQCGLQSRVLGAGLHWCHLKSHTHIFSLELLVTLPFVAPLSEQAGKSTLEKQYFLHGISKCAIFLFFLINYIGICRLEYACLRGRGEI